MLQKPRASSAVQNALQKKKNRYLVWCKQKMIAVDHHFSFPVLPCMKTLKGTVIIYEEGVGWEKNREAKAILN